MPRRQTHLGCGSKCNSWGRAGLGLWFPLARCHFGYHFFSHCNFFQLESQGAASGFLALIIHGLLNAAWPKTTVPGDPVDVSLEVLLFGMLKGNPGESSLF